MAFYAAIKIISLVEKKTEDNPRLSAGCRPSLSYITEEETNMRWI